MSILDKNFYNRNTLEVAKNLLGCRLNRRIDGRILSGIIVETEAYTQDDPACHAFKGKTPRAITLFKQPGIAYVYFIYGMYHCFNVITKEEGVPEGVLIRAIQPIEGIQEMSILRFNKDYDELTKAQYRNLSSGPSKLCIAMNINKENNKQDLCANELYIEELEEMIKTETKGKNLLPEKFRLLYDDKSLGKFEIVEAKRIGIDYAEEAKDFLWRFYIKNNPFVSTK